MATRSSDYASRGILPTFWRRGVEKPPELPLTASTTGKLLRLHLGPTAQAYGDSVESSGEAWDVFFDDQGKIPAARNEDQFRFYFCYVANLATRASTPAEQFTLI